MRTTVVALYVGQTKRIGVTQMETLVGDATHRREGQRIAVARVESMAVSHLQPVREVGIIGHGLLIFDVQVQLTLIVLVVHKHERRLNIDSLVYRKIVTCKEKFSHGTYGFILAQLVKFSWQKVGNGETCKEMVVKEISTHIGIEIGALVLAAIGNGRVYCVFFVEHGIIKTIVIDDGRQTERQLT